MSNLTTTTLRNAGLQKSQVHEFEFLFTTDSGAVSLSSANLAAPITFGTATGGTLSQDTIDALLGSEDEVIAATAFGATAMGIDAFGFVLNCGGQVASLQALIFAETAAAEAIVIPSGSAMPDTLTNGAYLTSEGNIAGRIIITGLDTSDDPFRVRLLVTLKTYA